LNSSVVTDIKLRESPEAWNAEKVRIQNRRIKNAPHATLRILIISGILSSLHTASIVFFQQTEMFVMCIAL
jgi:hypothetical protein